MRRTTKQIPNRKCRICGKEFYVKAYFVKHGWGQYCSRECQHKAYLKGKFVYCEICGKKVWRTPMEIVHSKSGKFFCGKSCQCAWKNKQRKNKKRYKLLWRPWCSSSTGVCGTPRADANSVGLPAFFLKLFKFKKKKIQPIALKRPSKQILYYLYWKENNTQVEIAKIFSATHPSVKRWLNYYKISIKPRSLSCGQNPNSIKNLELGKTPEVERKSAEARRIYSKEKLIEKIKEFVEVHSRIPTKNEFVHNSLYPDYVTYRDYFGTWNNAIKAAGYKPNDKWFSSRDLFAKDGHKCNSISEIIIDDWLFENNIFHNREKPYPKGRYLCDFVIGDIFIEFFGLANASNIIPDYNKIIKKKKKYVRDVIFS